MAGVSLLLPHSNASEADDQHGPMERDRRQLSLRGSTDDLTNLSDLNGHDLLMQVSGNTTLSWHISVPTVVPVSEKLWKKQTYESKWKVVNDEATISSRHDSDTSENKLR